MVPPAAALEPPGAPLIRGAMAQDAGAIATIMVANWRSTYQQQLSAGFLAGLDPVAEAAKWSDRLTRPGVSVLVAESREVLGFVACGPPFDADLDPAEFFQIYNLHVAPTARGLGVGKMLLRAAARLGANQARQLCLWVVPENNHARRFYELAGMRPDGTRQRESVSPGETLEELRYRGPIAALVTE